MQRNVLLLVPYFANRAGLAVHSVLRNDPALTIHVYNTAMRHDASGAYAGCKSVRTAEEQEDIASELLRIVEQERIDLVIPTKDPLVSLCSRLQDDLEGKTFLPSSQVIELLQDKGDTYDFFSGSRIDVPEHYPAIVENKAPVESLLALRGEAYEKPRKGWSGREVRRITRTDDIVWRDDLIVCEPLSMPEYNQTLLVRGGAHHGRHNLHERQRRD